ncbi:ISNCY family transposase [Mycobacterium helveticum]|uniref:ISNCY family transposase n=1 Tax=Mycobacterium helveticum TaxID=2592811 RepID=A0A557XXY1_9MYCO|nr:ISNCY family transposase [Mycobacterium helveticum]TVS86972.1 ISNCY family transposase [Mycobacterium helveticum]TVS90996.1 ISNCY family transposase [Mycobacterium helveticum]
MFRTLGDQPSLWESILPEEVRRLPEELARVDALLDDPAFFAPFAPFFDPRIGRPSTPMETYLRLMFLKFRYRLGFESLCREVSDSITWRMFCRIPLEVAVPHPTTLMKLTTRCGSAAVDGLNETLLAKAAEAKVLRTNRIRADTTVVPANVAYPTDSGLLAKAVRRIATTSKRVQAAGGAVRTGVRDRSRAAGKRAHAVAAKLRSRAAAGREEATAAVLKSTAELAGLAQKAARDAQRLLVNAKRAVRRAKAKAAEMRERGEHDAAAGRRRGRLVRAVNDLAKLVAATRQIVAQTRQRVSGQTPDGATRRVSLHDGDARPIAKGRLGRPVEFGYKAQVTDNDDGIVLDHTIEAGNPPDAPQLAPAVARVTKRTGRTPATVTADRGYGEKRVEDALHDLGVRTVVIPRKGKPGQARQAKEHRPAFRRTIKWRTGCEGRISTLKRGYGWDRTRIDNTEGARIWAGHGILTHNLVKISALAA